MRCVFIAAICCLTCGITLGQDGGVPTVSASKPAETPSNAKTTPALPLALQPDSRTAQISVEVRILTGPPEHFQTLNSGQLISTPPAKTPPKPPEVSVAELQKSGGVQLVTAEKVVEERHPVFVSRIQDAAVRKLIQAAQANEKTNISFAPKVTLLDGQEASVVDGAQRPFVVGFKPAGKQLQPIVEVTSVGTALNLRAKTLDEAIKMDVSIDLAEVTGVKTKKAGPQNAQVQVPSLAKTHVALSALVENGETLVISGLQHTRTARRETRKFGVFKNVAVAHDTQELLILITPREIQPAPAGRARLNNQVSVLDPESRTWCGTPAAIEKMMRINKIETAQAQP